MAEIHDFQIVATDERGARKQALAKPDLFSVCGSGSPWDESVRSATGRIRPTGKIGGRGARNAIDSQPARLPLQKKIAGKILPIC
jgi:hypothetical protein